MDPTANKALWQPWPALWNGDLAVAQEIAAPDFVAHVAPVGPSPAEVRGPDGLTEWIAGRWLFRATYRGGFPGAPAEAVGRRVEYAGTDLLRVADGQIAEYWLCADIPQLLQQTGVIPT